MKIFIFIFRIIFFGLLYAAQYWWITIPLIIIVGTTLHKRNTIKQWRAYWEEEKRWKEEQEERDNK